MLARTRHFRVHGVPIGVRDLLPCRESTSEELKKFAKSPVDVDTILTIGSDLKFTRIVQNRLSEWMMESAGRVCAITGISAPNLRDFS